MLDLYIVTYDITDPKRLQRVFKTVRDDGDHLQLSVFECQLSGADLAILRDKLREIIRADEDQVLFIRLPAAIWGTPPQAQRDPGPEGLSLADRTRPAVPLLCPVAAGMPPTRPWKNHPLTWSVRLFTPFRSRRKRQS